jgi:hypothetical protein
MIKGVSLKSKLQKKYITIKGVNLKKPSIFGGYLSTFPLHPSFLSPKGL